MKKILLSAALIVSFTGATALAQMSGHERTSDGQGHAGMSMDHSTMDMEHSSQTMSGHTHDANASSQAPHMMSGQKANREMTSDMASMMNAVNGMLKKMSHSFSHNGATEHGNMKEMGSVMHEMATLMHEMAYSMDQGKMDQQTFNKMHDRIKSMQQRLDAVQK